MLNKKEILTEKSKMSSYQIFHEGDCSVCCRATICNIFRCCYFKAVVIFLNTQIIGYGNTFRFDWLGMGNEVENVIDAA